MISSIVREPIVPIFSWSAYRRPQPVGKNGEGTLFPAIGFAPDLGRSRGG
jgi:hypothetical protein